MALGSLEEEAYFAAKDAERRHALREKLEAAAMDEAIAATLATDDEALADYAYALQLDPLFSYAEFSTANLHLRRERWEQAARHYSRALALDPDYAHAYKNRGFCQLKLGKAKLAAADFEAALRLLHPRDPARKESQQGLDMARERLRR